VQGWAPLPASSIDTALQQPQLGTGHAVMQALPHIDENAPTLVLYGDVPLTTPPRCSRLVEAAGDDKLAS
jgi:bifunctional UDP-N-acetylglucosamine pyrophosphorylase/glucosamine-1-phosphate N-acetyltransferase